MNADSEERGRAIVLSFLSSRPRTERQVRDRLEKAGIDPLAADRVVGWAKDLGYVNDVAFAEAWVSNRADRKNMSLRALVTELTRQGVARDVIDDVVERQPPDADDARAEVLAEQVVAKLHRKGVEGDVLVRRAVAAMQRKGFSAGLAVECVRRQTELLGSPVEEAGR